MIVAGDGNAYVPYANFQLGEFGDLETYLSVLRMSPDGTYNTIELGNWTAGGVGGRSCTGTYLGNLFDPSGNFTAMMPGAYYNVPWLTTITNGASGAAILAQLSINQCGGPPQPLNQISYVSQSGLTSQVTLALNPAVNTPANPVALSLQREDGSYIGADMQGNVFAFGADGSVQWQQQVGTGP